MTVAEPTVELTPEIEDALRAHPGKWVALTTKPVAILGIADTPSAAYKVAEDQGVEAPLIYRVPSSELRSYYY